MPDPKPALDYETPPKRPRFLEKLNPAATPRSVVRKAITSGLAAAVIWCLLRLNHNWHPEWWAFVCWEMSALIVGAVTEWQEPFD